jgi:HAD superfamily hydrolase (TIGR01509 family)
MVKVILFDLGNVVIPFDLTRAAENFMRVCAVPRQDVIHFFTRSEYDRRFVEGGISSEEFYEEAKRQLKMNIDFAQFKTFYNNIFEHNAELEALIRKLGVRYTLAVLSNTNQLHFDFIMETYPIMKEFDEYIVSFKEKCQKPQYEIFERALSRLKVAPQQVVFIDDTDVNVIAAAQIGMRGIIYTNPAELVEKLKKCGVAV